jgi:hypothetical protein
MNKVVLKNISSQGEALEATFLPEGGMNLVSYRLGDIEIIDQKTLSLYEEQMAGLGALIGPHFFCRQKISSGYDPSLFPHIARVKAQGTNDPFPHGIARYVPWKYVKSDTQIKAKLHGSDLYNRVPLSVFEGQDFMMSYEARLLDTGLFIEYKVESELSSVIGLHYYYALLGKGEVHGEVQPKYRDKDDWKPIPKEWTKEKESHLHFSLAQEADFGFIPAKKTPTDHDYRMILDTDAYSLHLDFNSASEEEISCQFYRPNKSSYVCIEPLSARVPLKPKLTCNLLEVKLEIFPPLSECF